MTADDELRRTVQELNKTQQGFAVAVAQLTATVENLAATVAAMSTNTVSVVAFDALRQTVDRNDIDSRERDEDLEKAVEKNAANWSRLAWALGLLFLGAVATLVGWKGQG